MIKESRIEILLNDGFLIEGIHTTNNDFSPKIVIFIHGFTGHRNEHIFFNCSKFFAQKGIDSFRFNLYSDKKKSRKFVDTSLSIHAKDVSQVITSFKNRYKQIYLVGHSFGGVTLLITELENVTSIIFWDVSYIDVKQEMKDFDFIPSLNCYVMRGHVDCLVGVKYIEELKKFFDCGDLVSKINLPVKFITAGKMGNSEAGKKYFARANEPKELHNIPDADHCFDSYSAESELFEETFKWVML